MTTRSLSSMIAATTVVIGALLVMIACASGTSTDGMPTGTVVAGSPADASPITATQGDPVHVGVPAVGIDAAVRPIIGTSGEVDPPTDDDAWWWTERGRPGSRDTVFIAGHTLDGGGGVFGRLRGVRPGAQIRVDTTAGSRIYRVDATAVYSKSELERYDEVWQSVPGRLILVTCRLDAAGGSTDDNLLVYASLTG
ncbi:class F sortase [Gordonia desulfuricans]|uniref:Class F sortase n=1 Tax=Gordonia desulfuricans TaxID=89051 RepID=A0A7K3LR78_9ACTN|nr:class F sortase [Gordonia desulfuricans]NDK90057.1 class F sortase [Gordonia desulfuricans]